MNRLRRFALIVTAALCLLTPLLNHAAAVEVRSAELPVTEMMQDEQLLDQIRLTYQTAKKTARVKSFKGKCGRYAGLQLVVLGINTKYVGCNGKNAYDAYKNKTETSGGYQISAYPAKEYSLKEALQAIAANDSHARNILVGFEKGTSKAGKKYGHVMFIHGIESGLVYFSDSYAQTVDGRQYKEGEPIVCSIDTFAELYKRYKLDGVIHFE
ncbi:MAG: hypothetical protein IIZ82_01035 [Clostridia bacterium]|nr:hypothetical protein [Clostridia bacterium]